MMMSHDDAVNAGMYVVMHPVDVVITALSSAQGKAAIRGALQATRKVAALAAVLFTAFYVWYNIWGEGPPPPAPLFERIVGQVCDVLDGVVKRSGERVEWFIVEGSLLAALRYGRMDGVLDSRVDKPDHDIDIAVGTRSEEEWEDVRESLLAEFEALGWTWCWRKNTAADIDDRLDKITCEYGGRVPLIMSWTHVDIHNYITPGPPGARDREKQALPFVYSHRRSRSGVRASSRVPPWSLVSTRVPATDERMVAMGADRIRSKGDNPSAPHEDDVYGGYPFEYWDGKMPIDLIYPLAKCRLYSRTVPCPNKTLKLLRLWHGAEHAYGCIGYPLGDLTASDMAIIRERSEQLHAAGFRSMRDALNMEPCLSQQPAK
eukprot:TRINITY_DN60495_c0_g1_i1.p1 TRINITY_DN60495_c0_g1~~TRINITY_DN60495_c0_g1_i1.p1  ORF type:complete len:375 (-),score=125.64 TRINITY_DN60495_c0_g1_i1:306-1430(-)